MPKLPTLPDVSKATGTTRDDFNNWLKQGFLRDRLPDPVPGMARLVPKRVATQMAVMKALVRGGLNASDAADKAYELIRNKNRPAWYAFDSSRPNDPTAELAFGDEGAETPLKEIARMLGRDETEAEEPVKRRAKHFAVVHLAGILQDIDALFGKSSD